MIYEEGSADAPYTVFQDWGDKLGCYSFSSLDECEKDGQNEWYIYRLEMERPAHYMLGNLIKSAKSINLPTGKDPGYYASTDKFEEQIKASQDVFNAHDYKTCPDMIDKLSAEIEATLSLKINPIVEGIYIIESAYEGFEKSKGQKMAIRCVSNDDSALDGDYRFKWEASPMNDGASMDSTFCFELISATSSDGETENSYYIKNVATGEYLGTNSTLYSPITSTSDREISYTIIYRGNASFEIMNPAGINNSLFINNHKNGSATKGDIVYGPYAEEYSRWNLRLISANLTSISSPATDGDEVISIHYYTPAGISISAPVKGLNIVKYVYANGVVKSKKIFK